MSWAADRQTTRIEDIAYCLLGIFDVNMPLLYGEGLKAYTRLQEEIIRESNDLSLFAWRAKFIDQTNRGILASTPSEFRDSGTIRVANESNFSPDFLMTNKGLRLVLDLYPGQNGSYLMALNCVYPDGRGGDQKIGIWVKMHGGGVYSRVKSDEFGVINPGELQRFNKSNGILVSKSISSSLSVILDRSHRGAFFFRKGFNEYVVSIHDPNSPFLATEIGPKEYWDSQRRMFLTYGASSFAAYAYFHAFLFAFGKTDSSTEPWLTVSKVEGGEELTVRVWRDLRKLEAVGSKRKERHVILNQGKWAGKRVDVSLEKVTIEGQEVYCIDITHS